MAIDVDAARADTEGVQHVIHLDNAGSSLVPRPVVDTVVAHLRREEQVGGYRAAAEAAERRDSVYSSLARLVGASPGEIAVQESGSTAWATAVSGLPLVGRRVLLGRGEYWHNVLVLRRLARRNCAQPGTTQVLDRSVSTPVMSPTRRFGTPATSAVSD